MSAPKGVVYIVEDDQSFRRSMKRLIRAWGCEVVAFESANSFLAQPSIRHPACLLLDVKLPDIDGLRLQQKLIDNGYCLPIIFMTGHSTVPMSVQAMKKGAVDFLPKPFQQKDLLSAVLQALDCDAHRLQEELQKQEINALIETLTRREKEVLRWVITGRLNKQIAYDLGVCEKTIKVHRGRIMQKTKVSSVAALVRLAEKVNISPVD